MLEHYHTLLASSVANPDRPISALPMLTPAEQQQVLAWSDDAQIYLLDGNLQLVPIGVPGDVYITDAGLSTDSATSLERCSDRAVPHPTKRDQAGREDCQCGAAHPRGIR